MYVFNERHPFVFVMILMRDFCVVSMYFDLKSMQYFNVPHFVMFLSFFSCYCYNLYMWMLSFICIFVEKRSILKYLLFLNKSILFIKMCSTFLEMYKLFIAQTEWRFNLKSLMFWPQEAIRQYVGLMYAAIDLHILGLIIC